MHFKKINRPVFDFLEVNKNGWVLNLETGKVKHYKKDEIVVENVTFEELLKYTEK